MLDDPFLFGMYSVEAFLDFELLVFFLLRWKPQKTRHVAVLGLAYLCFGIARLLLMFWDYAAPGPGVANAGYYITAAFFAFVAMSVFMHAAETLIKKTRHVLTIGFLGLSCIILFFPPVMYGTVKIIYYIFAPVLILFVVSFLFYLMSMTSGRVRKKFFVVFIGLALYGLGYALSADPFHISKEVTESIVLTGLACTALGFIEIPMLEELHWRDYLLHVFAFHIDTSVCIHDETLLKIGKEDEGVSADLFSSGVTGVIGIIKEMIQSEKKLKVLDHEDKKILLEYGKYVTVALITKKDLDILHEKLRTYIYRVETELRQPLETWRGEVSRFGPQIKSITTDVLKTVIDKNWWRVDPRSVAHQVTGFVKGLIPKDLLSRHLEKKLITTSKKDVVFKKEEPVQPPKKPADSSPVPPEADPWPAPDPAKNRASATSAPSEASPVVAPVVNAVQPRQETPPAMPAGQGSSGSEPVATKREATGEIPDQQPPVQPSKTEKPVKATKKAPTKATSSGAAPGSGQAPKEPATGRLSEPGEQARSVKAAQKPAAGKKKK